MSLAVAFQPWLQIDTAHLTPLPTCPLTSHHLVTSQPSEIIQILAKMILSSVLASSLLAYTANAFLLPLEIADKVEQSQAPNGAPSIFNHNSQTVKIDCSSCPFALASSRNGQHEWKSGVKNDLILDLSAKDDELLLNGHHIYPLNTKAIPTPIKVKQVKQADESSENSPLDGDLSLSYSVALSPERQYTGPGQNEFGLVDLTLTLLGVDGQMINVEDVNVKLIKGAEGRVSNCSGPCQ